MASTPKQKFRPSLGEPGFNEFRELKRWHSLGEVEAIARQQTPGTISWCLFGSGPELLKCKSAGGLINPNESARWVRVRTLVLHLAGTMLQLLASFLGSSLGIDGILEGVRCSRAVQADARIRRRFAKTRGPMSGRTRALVSSRPGSKSQERSMTCAPSSLSRHSRDPRPVGDRAFTAQCAKNVVELLSARGQVSDRLSATGNSVPFFVVKARGYSKTFSHDKLLKAYRCRSYDSKLCPSSGQDPSTKEFYDVFRFLIAQLDPVCLQR